MLVGQPSAHAVLLADAERVELVAQPPDPGTEDHATAAELVGGGEHLRGRQRVAVRQHEHRGAERDARGRLGQRAEQHQGLVDVVRSGVRELARVVVRVRRRARRGEHDVVGDPHGREACSLGVLCEIDAGPRAAAGLGEASEVLDERADEHRASIRSRRRAASAQNPKRRCT